MKKNPLCFFIIFILTFSQPSYADAIYSILNGIHHLESIEAKIQGFQSGMLQSQLDIEGLMKNMNNSLTGNSGWGTYQYHDYQSYGEGAQSWASVMHMAEMGNGSGALGQTVNAISNQFPIDKNSFNKGVLDANNQKYYSLQSQTILATRAASQLDYDKIQDQIGYQQMLQQQIEKTKDLKGAVDLNNRIQVESNLISLEILRQSALSNQQQSMTEQVKMNSALSNAKFLSK